MNFLAHLYLSGNNEEIIVGNLLGDFMRGKKIESFPSGIAKGIQIHRKIDVFTDTHPIVLQTKNRLRPFFNHYSGVIIDIYYDHFLASNWATYNDISLKDFTTTCYDILKKNRAVFPPRFQQALKYKRFRNLLCSYSKISGIKFAFNRLANRTSYPSNLKYATCELENNYGIYHQEFKEFFPELMEYAKEIMELEKKIRII
ncbi:MAG TPA: ACP phosphodiesterase [Bacteroidales bacterium]|nr:ACP phosphodiesterase [Bacteroidales bacterium]HPS45596.1 ACP phosphodiesterase [Bacteroidales bacterium]